MFCHTNNIVHGDVKPSNILFHDGEGYLIDFGSAEMLNHKCYGTDYGTVLYMAPEVLSDNQHDFSRDIWALGLCILEWVKSLPINTERFRSIDFIQLLVLAPKKKLKRKFLPLLIPTLTSGRVDTIIQLDSAAQAH